MRKATVVSARTALAGQARSFFPPQIPITGYPVQNLANTAGPGMRSHFNWQATCPPIDDASIAKLGAGATRANFAKLTDPGLDLVDKVTYNTYEGGSPVARMDRFGKEVENILVGYPNTDEKYIRQMLKPRPTDDHANRVKYYGMLAVPRALTLFLTKSTVVGLLLSFGPKADMKAASTLEFDISGFSPGQVKTIMWMGKPVFVHNRTPEQIEESKNTPMSELKDPETDEQRHKNPAFTVMIGICTHLGCIPISGGGDYSAYLCPCHGSHYDFSGRIRKGPAPLNLEIPPYYYMSDDTVLIGKDQA